MFSEKGRLGVLRHGTVLESLLLPVQQYRVFFPWSSELAYSLSKD